MPSAHRWARGQARTSLYQIITEVGTPGVAFPAAPAHAAVAVLSYGGTTCLRTVSPAAGGLGLANRRSRRVVDALVRHGGQDAVLRADTVTHTGEGACKRGGGGARVDVIGDDVGHGMEPRFQVCRRG